MSLNQWFVNDESGSHGAQLYKYYKNYLKLTIAYIFRTHCYYISYYVEWYYIPKIVVRYSSLWH